MNPIRIAVPLAFALVGLLATGAASAETADNKADQAEAAPPTGVSLGQFWMRETRTIEGVKLRMNFTIYATVKDAEGVAKEVLEAPFKAREHRIRDEVITATRLCKLAEFQEPGLETFRRRVLLRLRRAMPELPIDRILVGKFEVFFE